jgi:hypothetical protein
LEVVGHVEQELTVGMIDQAATTAFSSDFLQQLTAEIDAGNYLGKWYFTALHPFDQAEVDSAIDSVLALSERHDRFWQEYRVRVNGALREEFDIPITVQLRPRHAGLGPALQLFVDDLQGRKDRGESLFALPPPAAPTPAPKDAPSSESVHAYSLRHTDGDWVVQFEGKTALLPRMVGFFYIARLLEHPREAFSGIDLSRMYNQFQKPPDDRIASFTDDEASNILQQSLENPGNDLNIEIDRVGYRAVCKKLQQLQADREAEIREGRKMAADEIGRHIMELQEWLGRSFEPSGRPRQITSEWKKAHDRVRNAIERAIKCTHKKCLQFHRHLRKCIKSKHLWSYEPETDIRWDT